MLYLVGGGGSVTECCKLLKIDMTLKNDQKVSGSVPDQSESKDSNFH